MVTLQQDIELTSTVVEHWWQYARRDHRLFFRLMNEKPEHLARLPYLEILITHIDRNRVKLLRMTYPKPGEEMRNYLLSSERYFLGCLRALRSGNDYEAELFYNMAHADLSMLQYGFMACGVKSYI